MQLQNSITYSYISNDHLLTVTYNVTYMYNYVAKHMTYNTKPTINLLLANLKLLEELDFLLTIHV